VRFLADMGVSITTVQALRAAVHDAVHLREEGLIRLPDPGIVAKAAQEQRVVLTFDLDFGDILAVARAEAPSVIIFRLRNQTPAAVNPRLFRVIGDCESELVAPRSVDAAPTTACATCLQAAFSRRPQPTGL
jgi:predicted nuclease of predicted toxin-antitoxin system